jgi:predicted DNA-binding protein (UPF0251 family)
MMRGRRRRGKYGRRPSPVKINYLLEIKAFNPEPDKGLEPVFLEPAEVEAMRLIDLEDLNQQEAGDRMGVSRGTIWRLVQMGRRKVMKAFIEGRRIEVHESLNKELT